MNFIKCFDVVSMVVEEATKQFAPIWKIDNKKYEILAGYCNGIDELIEEFDGESCEAEVDEIEMYVSISVECLDFTAQTKTHIFYRLLQRAIEVSFSTSENGLLKIKFVFPELWSRN